MADLTGIPLCFHLDHLFQKNGKYFYSLLKNKIAKPHPDLDTSVILFGKPAATPLGPAAGPHTQLAQNIVMSYLAGGRIIELKTIQEMDQITISRPCIDIRNIGFNIEWSQELSLHNSYQEYLKAWIILHVLREQDFLGAGQADPFYDFIFDMSVGYDIQGIRSEKVSDWLNKMANAGEDIQYELDNLPDRYKEFKSIKISGKVSDSVTLSTFHGCPVTDIEDIVKHLISTHHLNVVIKLNPTILGHDYVKNILSNELGYQNIELDPAAFESDLSLDSAVYMIHKLDKYAKLNNKSIGVKFTNTLVVKNSESVFEGQVRYLSGAPLYVLAMHSMQALNRHLGYQLPLSFSGGINQNNFAEAVACNLIPVTSCTDLLKKGGYSRMNNYLENLHHSMIQNGAVNMQEYILKSAGLGSNNSIGDAARINTENLIDRLKLSAEYHFKSNNRIPARINSQLSRFDCLNCDICIPVCPNSANFYYQVIPGKYTFHTYRIDMEGNLESVNTNEFEVKKDQQIGNIAEFCNDCGNCETFCPETGAPFLDKLRFYLYETTYHQDQGKDGVYFKSETLLKYRQKGISYQLEFFPENSSWHWSSDHFSIMIDKNGNPLKPDWYDPHPSNASIDGMIFRFMSNLIHWHRIFCESCPYQFPCSEQ